MSVMKKRCLPGVVGLVLMVGGCSGEPVATESQPTSPASPTVAASPQNPAPAAAPGSSLPLVPVPKEAPVQSLPAPPNLIPATTALQRLPQVNAGRRDPFSPVLGGPVVVSIAPAQAVQPPSPPLLPAPPSSTFLPPVGVTAQPVPQPPQVRVPAAPNAPAAAPAPLSLARAITINGVVQVGNRVNIIVQVPNEGSSRYVSVGDRLAGGRVLVKRVDMGGGEPRVVLEQDGVEVVRMVESNA
jgi:hypothetical protein